MRVDEAMAWSKMWVQAQTSTPGIAALLSERCCLNYHLAARDRLSATGREAVVSLFAREASRRESTGLNVENVMFDTDAMTLAIIYDIPSIDVLLFNSEGEVVAIDVFSERVWTETGTA